MDATGDARRLGPAKFLTLPEPGASMQAVSRVMFAIMALALTACAGGLVILSAWSLFDSKQPLESRALDTVGFLVIAIAVFDVAKYLLEEEVIHGRERRHVSEARRTLTRFVTTVIIAVCLEGVVLAFKVVRGDYTQVMFPAALLMTGLAMLIGLGAFQYLSAKVEQRVGRSDDRSVGRDAADREDSTGSV